jgi:hypothetical protein
MDAKRLRLAGDTNLLLDLADPRTSDPVLNPFDLTPPVIATPREIVRKFFR